MDHATMPLPTRKEMGKGQAAQTSRQQEHREEREQHQRPIGKQKTCIGTTQRKGKPRKHLHGTGTSSHEEALVLYWNFQELISYQKMRPDFKVHMPNCRCKKMAPVHQKVALAAPRPSILSKGRWQGGNEMSKRVSRGQRRQGEGSLIVVHNCSRVTAAFACAGTSTHRWNDDPRRCEETLREAIFDSSLKHQVKVSCAQCVLEVNPNGAVVIIGYHHEMMGLATTAKMRAEEKKGADEINGASGGKGEKSSLHHDHAHLIMALPVPLVAACLSKTATRTDMNNLYAWALGGKVGVSSCSSNSESDSRDETSGHFPLFTRKPKPIEFKHHLQCVWFKQSKDPLFFFRNAGGQIPQLSAASLDELLVLVMAYDDGDHWTLDLPGGKRHLGEDVWTCARRETFDSVNSTFDKRPP